MNGKRLTSMSEITESAVAPVRPILRYHGGKWKLARWVIDHLPAHRVYVEPFGGAASVLMQKARSYSEVYNDLDGEVVNVFRVLRSSTESAELKRALKLTPFAREEFKLAYEASDDPIEQARRTIVRAFMGFGSAAASGYNTGFRANGNRSGTTPAHDWANYAEGLPVYVARLAGVVIENRPAAEVIQQHDGPGTLHYIDPPYLPGTRNQGSPYCKKGAYRHEMTDDDHDQLAALLHSLGGMVALSGYPSAMYDGLYADWKSVEREAQADGARARVEVLWLNPAAWRAKTQGVMAFDAPA